jgi:spore germination protein YaaH
MQNLKADNIGQTIRICDEKIIKKIKTHISYHGHEIDFENVDMSDRADTIRT